MTKRPSKSKQKTLSKRKWIEAEQVERPEFKKDDDCQICLEKLDKSTSSFVNGCKHIFCDECIRAWSQTSTSCPVCRHEFNAITLYVPPSPIRNGRKRIKISDTLIVKKTDKRYKYDNDPWYDNDIDSDSETDSEDDFDYVEEIERQQIGLNGGSKNQPIIIRLEQKDILESDKPIGRDNDFIHRGSYMCTCYLLQRSCSLDDFYSIILTFLGFSGDGKRYRVVFNVDIRNEKDKVASRTDVIDLTK